MRHLIRLVIPLLLLFGGISCSSNHSVTPKSNPAGSSTGILLTVDDTPENAFSDLINYFKERGFRLEEINRFQHYLRTDFKTMDSEMYTYSIEAVIPPADSTVVVFRAQAIGPQVQSPARITKNMGRFSSALWDKFHQSVVEFPHQSIYYTSD